MSRKVIGKFRNAEFIVTSDEMAFGRRNQVHEYPLRDVPYVEDIGKKAREQSINVLIMGDNFEADRDRLIEALEQPGPGTLEHPDFGMLSISIISARMSYNSKAHGKVNFSISFIPGEAEPRYPTSSNDTAALVDAQADPSLADAIDDFAETFNVLGLVDDQVQEIVDELDNVLAAIDNAAGTVTEPLASLIRTPANLGAALAGAVSAIGTTLFEPLQALNLYSSLFNTGDDSPVIPTTTPSRQQQAAGTAALHDLVKRSALIEACRSSSQAEYAAYDDAVNVRDALLDELDVQMQVEGMADAVYLSLSDLRVAVVNDIRTRGADLSRLISHIPLTTLPALVIAHQLYGDAERESEIVTRNNVRHPGFVPGGKNLEVLTDV